MYKSGFKSFINKLIEKYIRENLRVKVKYGYVNCILNIETSLWLKDDSESFYTYSWIL